MATAKHLIDTDRFNNYDTLLNDADELSDLRTHDRAVTSLADISNRLQQDSEPRQGLQGMVDRRLQIRQTSNQLVTAGCKAATVGQENTNLRISNEASNDIDY